jgi:hypothetical protein
MSKFERINNISELETGNEYMISMVIGNANPFFKYKAVFKKIVTFSHGKGLWFKVYDDNFNKIKHYDFIIMEYQFELSICIYKLPSLKIGQHRLLQKTMPNIANEVLTRFTTDYLFCSL